MFRLFRKPDASEASRILRASGKWERKLQVRAKCDQMLRDMGRPPIDWNAL